MGGITGGIDAKLNNRNIWTGADHQDDFFSQTGKEIYKQIQMKVVFNQSN